MTIDQQTHQDRYAELLQTLDERSAFLVLLIECKKTDPPTPMHVPASVLADFYGVVPRTINDFALEHHVRRTPFRIGGHFGYNAADFLETVDKRRPL